MQLNISQVILNKLNYFLRRFSSKEWSGPAWYALNKKGEHGFPKVFELVDFHPLDLGSSASTEWDADALAKIVKKKYEKNEKYKSCFIGLVHSHHSMDAYFSGTDEDTLEEMAPNTGFYPSLVVSTKAGKEYAFAISYLDQYQKETIVHGEIALPKPKEAKQWVEIADKIEKEAKTTLYVPKGGYTGYNYAGYQSSMWDEAGEKYDEDVLREGRDIWSKFKNPQNEMDYYTMMEEMKKLKIQAPYKVFGGMGWRY